MKYLSIGLLQIFCAFTMNAQTKDCTQCWKVTTEKTNLYFTNLFGAITGNNPNLTEIKLEFADSKMVYVTGIQVIKEYCKQKYKLADSAIRNFTNQFIRQEIKIPLADTVLFKKLDTQFSSYSFFPDSVLDKYRVLGVRNFMIKYCNGGTIKDSGVPLSIIAYLFENRIFWENVTFKIASYSLDQIESSCKIRWDYKDKKWIDLTTNKAIATIK